MSIATLVALPFSSVLGYQVIMGLQVFIAVHFHGNTKADSLPVAVECLQVLGGNCLTEVCLMDVYVVWAENIRLELARKSCPTAIAKTS